MSAKWQRFIAALIVVAGGIIAAACSDDSFEPVDNRAPDTGLATAPPIAESPDTSFYQIRLKWWGSDPDGEVAGYFYRWTALDSTAETYDLETDWTYTGFHAKTFFLPVTDDFASFTFEVKAVDDQGLADETPAEQQFPFYNNRPTGEIRFKDLLPAESWPVISFGWDAIDPDGDSTISRHLIWVKGREADPLVFEAEIDSVLLTPTMIDTFGNVTFFYQTIDEGHAASDPDSFDIFLWRTSGDVLLVDDNDVAANPLIDSDGFYRDFMLERLGDSLAYTLLDLEERPFDTNTRFAAFLDGFEHVVWYSGLRSAFDENDADRFDQLTLADSGLGVHLDRGRSFFVASLNAIGFLGGLSPEFYKQYLGVDSLYINRATGGTSFEFVNTAPAYEIGTMLAAEGSGLPDLPLKFRVRYSGGFDSPDTTRAGHEAELLYRLPKGTLKNQWILLPDTIAVDSLFDTGADTLIAVDTFRIEQDTLEVGIHTGFRHEIVSGGRSVVCTFPLSIHSENEDNDDALHTLFDWLDVPRVNARRWGN